MVILEGKPFGVLPGESPLHGLHRWRASDLPSPSRSDFAAVRGAFAGHDRVVIVDSHLGELPAFGAPVYTWQVCGSETPVAPYDPDRLMFQGVLDEALGVVPVIEAARAGRWPFPVPLTASAGAREGPQRWRSPT